MLVNLSLLSLQSGFPGFHRVLQHFEVPFATVGWYPCSHVTLSTVPCEWVTFACFPFFTISICTLVLFFKGSQGPTGKIVTISRYL